MKVSEIVGAIFNSYAYNREFSYMIKLCKEVAERVNGCAIKHAEDSEDVERFEINTIIEYFPTPEEIKEQLNEKFGVASSDKEEGIEPIYCDTDSLKEIKGGDNDV